MSDELYPGAYPAWQTYYIPTLDEWKSWFSRKIDWVGNDATGTFYADDGAHILRLPDRALIGAAADNQATRARDTTPTDWLSALMSTTSIGAWPMWGATHASLARFGTIGTIGGSRTSDATSNATSLGYTPSSIGVASWAVDDDLSNPRTTTAYAFYGEVWRQNNVSYQPCFAMELEAVNFGEVPTGYSTPYHPNLGGGAYTVQLGAGGGQSSGTADVESALTLVSNPNRFRQGIVFSATALAGTDGVTSGGYGSAVVMATNHGIEWRTAETSGGVIGLSTGGMIYSTVEEAASGQRLQFSDSGFLILNNAGAVLASVGTNAAPNNSLQFQAGSGTQAAGIYVQEGTNGSPNLGLYPATGGELQITSPLTASGAKLSDSDVAAAWLQLNVNGTSYRIPLFTPVQAGG